MRYHIYNKSVKPESMMISYSGDFTQITLPDDLTQKEIDQIIDNMNPTDVDFSVSGHVLLYFDRES